LPFSNVQLTFDNADKLWVISGQGGNLFLFTVLNSPGQLPIFKQISGISDPVTTLEVDPVTNTFNVTTFNYTGAVSLYNVNATTGSATRGSGGRGNYRRYGGAFQPPGPIAEARGPYTITEGDSLTLNALPSSDPSLTYSWTINGHANAASGAKPTLTYSQLQA